ncbi:hypothetical protein Pmani_035181 [Petrolisthes manimaculis]|uniref:Uncharacterized protein n=1 Tax=Petrolisthes manimaculis TaxID=1843537 RepID=A0AAE1TNX9_9EUCA|nr:hypothetical protein Pmani_035181 [Petrolisthes manimaculis]
MTSLHSSTNDHHPFPSPPAPNNPSPFPLLEVTSNPFHPLPFPPLQHQCLHIPSLLYCPSQPFSFTSITTPHTRPYSPQLFSSHPMQLTTPSQSISTRGPMLPNSPLSPSTQLTTLFQPHLLPTQGPIPLNSPPSPTTPCPPTCPISSHTTDHPNPNSSPHKAPYPPTHPPVPCMLLVI